MSYWETRNEELYKAGEMQVNEYFKKLEKAFNQTKRELQKTVESFYWRYAEENGLTYAAAQKQLDKAEIRGLREFVELSMQNIGKYNQEVNNMSIKARMTRYQALEAQVDAMLRQLYAVDYQAEAEKTMQEIYTDTYNRTWYNIDQYRGFHSAFAQVNPHSVEKLLEYPFNGANFSDRLWKQKDHLQTVLMESITTMMVQGVPPQNLAKDFAKKMQSKKFDAYRLLHTESSFLMGQATHAGYIEDGIEKYQILATLDSKTCGICGEQDGKIYLVKDAVVGKNMWPFHPFCRCCDTAYYDDEELSDQTRTARDPETGKTYEVPADMTYPEWKKVVDGDGDFTKWKAERDKKRDDQKHYAARRGEWKKVAELSKQSFKPAETVEEAQKFAESKGVKYVVYENMPLETANEFNKALMTIPEDIRPVFVGDSASLEEYRRAKLPRRSDHFYGVHIDIPPDGLMIGRDNTTGQAKYDFDVQGQMVGISKKFNLAEKITKNKIAEQKKYIDKHGNRWFFNEDGRSTPYHEMGHVYVESKGLPDGFERDAERWYKESKCDMLKNPVEAWSEAWGAYHTDNPELPDYIAKYIDDVTLIKHSSVAKVSGSDIMKVVETMHKSVGAKTKNYDVFDPVTGDIVHLAEGTRITQPKNHIMAGKGRERQIDCEDWLNAKYPEADPNEWTKEKGFGYVTDEYGDERKVELHWYQNPKTGKVEMKIKLHDGRRFIEDD